MTILFILGGVVTFLAKVFSDHAQKELRLDKLSLDQQRELQERAYYGVYGDHAIAKNLLDAPSSLWFLFYGTLVVLPLLSLIIGFDQIAGDVQHRSIRYFVGRARRPSLVIGKALAMWGVLAVMIFVLDVIVWGAMIVRGDATAGVTLSWGLRFYVYAVCAGGAMVGLTSLMSSFFRVPILSLLVGVGAAFGMFVVRAIVAALSFKFDWIEPAKWVFPASYETLMVKPDALPILGGCVGPVVWGAIVVGFAALIVQKKDV